LGGDRLNGESHSIRARGTTSDGKKGTVSDREEGIMSDTANQMDPAQIQAFLEAPRHAIAAVLRPDGAPQLSPIWFLYEDKRLYFSTLLNSAKYRQLSRDPRIALCIDAGHPDARAVSISGIAEFMTDESPERADLEWRILRRYHESDEEAHRWETAVAEEGPGVLVVVSPERIIGWDYN
jgi:PPOX class probable F420-dependent enzyme